MSVRRFRSLVRGLPVSARVWTDSNGGWTVTDHLLALNVEVNHAVFRQLLASTPTKYPRKLPPPLRIPRPGEQTKPSNVVRPRELFARLMGR